MGPSEGSLSPADARELGQLRRRAYGPDADIASDPRAQSRLAELESAVGGLPPAGRTVLEPRSPVAAQDQAPLSGRGQREGSVVVVTAPPAATQSSWHRPWVWMLAAGILIAIGALAISIPGLLTGAPDDTLNMRAVFEETTEQEMIELDRPPTIEYLGLLREEVRLYEEFRGLSVWSAPTIHGTTCLIVTSGALGFWEAGCAPPGESPRVELHKYANDLGHRDGVDPWHDMPFGSVIRLTLRGDTVLVWDLPAPGPTPLFD